MRHASTALLLLVTLSFCASLSTVSAAVPIEGCKNYKCPAGQRCFLFQSATGGISAVCRNYPQDCQCGGNCYITKELRPDGRCPVCKCP